jgi:hypothetical protein
MSRHANALSPANNAHAAARTIHELFFTRHIAGSIPDAPNARKLDPETRKPQYCRVEKCGTTKEVPI